MSQVRPPFGTVALRVLSSRPGGNDPNTWLRILRLVWFPGIHFNRRARCQNKSQGHEQIKWAEKEEEILTEQMQGLSVPVIVAKSRSKKESRLSIGQTGVMLHTSNVMKLTTITQCPWLLMKNNISSITGEASINHQSSFFILIGAPEANTSPKGIGKSNE